MENLCKQASPDAVARLIEWMASDNAKASVSACMGILNRAYGSPKQAHEHSGPEGAPIPVAMIELRGVKPA